MDINQPLNSLNQINSFNQANAVPEQCQIIRPATKTGLLLMQSFFMTLVLSAFFLIGLGTFLVAIMSAIFGINGLIGALIGIPLIFILIWIINYQLRLRSLKKTEYRFYSDRLEYFEGFLVKNRKTINYDRITNIGQRKGIIENWFGLGTIMIDTAGSSSVGNELSLTYMENPDTIYDWISKVVSSRSQIKR